VFSVDELPDGTLLVTFLATQRLWGEWRGRGVGGRGGMGEREGKTWGGRMGRITLNLMWPEVIVGNL